MGHTILILTNRVPYPLHDGGALAMDAMIHGYQKAGWQVHLLAMNTSRHFVDADVLKGLYNDLASFQTVAIDNRISKGGIIKNLLFSREPEHADRFRSAAFSRTLVEMLRQIRPDVVQLESPFLASYIPVIRSNSKASIVYRAHNIESQIWSRFAAESFGLKRIYLRILSRRMARSEQKLWYNADLILAITKTDADAMRESNANTHIVVAPFGIKTTNDNTGFPSGPLKVYHIGAMDWLPNQEAVSWFLKEVWPALHRQTPDVEFHLAGRGMPDSFKENLPQGVCCHGEVTDAKAFIADKHVLVVSLRSGSGIRVKTLEAMAAGKLVISTDIGMQGIDAQPDLHYLRANTAQEFTHLIASASTHPDIAESIARAGERLIREQYDAGTIMQRAIKAIEQLKTEKPA